MSLITRILDRIIANGGKASPKQRAWLKDNRGRFSKQQNNRIRSALSHSTVVRRRKILTDLRGIKDAPAKKDKHGLTMSDKPDISVKERKKVNKSSKPKKSLYDSPPTDFVSKQGRKAMAKKSRRGTTLSSNQLAEHSDSVAPLDNPHPSIKPDEFKRADLGKIKTKHADKIRKQLMEMHNLSFGHSKATKGKHAPTLFPRRKLTLVDSTTARVASQARISRLNRDYALVVERQAEKANKKSTRMKMQSDLGTKRRLKGHKPLDEEMESGLAGDKDVKAKLTRSSFKSKVDEIKHLPKSQRYKATLRLIKQAQEQKSFNDSLAWTNAEIQALKDKYL